jgi:dTDP-4-amino-4,6-dideoxygalactose transaminase
MLLTDHDDVAERARILRAHGMSISDLDRHRSAQVVIEEYQELGFNYRMTDMQAAIGVEQLRRLEDMIERRRVIATRYADAFRDIEGLQLPYSSDDTPHTYQSYMVRLGRSAGISRDELMQRLLTVGIATRRGVMAIHTEPYYRSRYPGVRLPETEAATRETMLLPIYATMTDVEQEYVIDHMLNILTVG